ncbi:MAG: FtsX-like permease family protein [Candidatus Aminicenantes bacterium]|nr:FtsX-like permease family protein [Candidatus Aminicenantes bacterium]NIM84750.1 FtsX-like permease family protein [Candidatus Aminicenantes bacterium]NIN24243.1 FtsX-like permease family protein [Candidatus Aminicenantes bacterium]NIN48003.1 FtsX-like permease family protein [Candidatus Aminicenantes bacterium]NIN90906.1 FtsX-like permease family protein [Candidatus Aminicenantes bacterium]
MKFEFFIARRYLTKGRKSSFISVISLVSTIGIAIGVAALIIALALINGFQGDIRDKILGSTAHILVNSFIGDGLDGYEPIIKEIREQFDEITSARPVVYGTVLVKGSSRLASGAILRGVDLEASGSDVWARGIEHGVLPKKKNQLLVGSEIASRLGVLPHDRCMVITPEPTLSPSGPIPKIKRLEVSGIFKTGLYEFDNGTVITNLETAQKLFKLGDKISYIQVYLKDLFAAEAVGEKLREMLPVGLQVITWKELNASLYSALKLEKTVLFFTLTLIIIVASLNIIAGLILLVIQKIRDIGILLSYGASPRIIKRIFFLQGSVIGIIGTTAGVIIGLLFCFLGNKFQLIRVPYDIYHMSHVPFKIGLFDFIAVVVVALIISFTATLIPSKKAASVNVVDAIKNE